MAVSMNMGPFAPVNLKGGAVFNAVPTFTSKLPLTRGGLAGPDAYFGRVVSIDPVQPRQFLKGLPTGKLPFGVLVQDPTIGYADPAMNNYYFEGRPATVVTYGLIEMQGWDLTQMSPQHGMTIIANTTTGVIGFTSATTIPTGYVQITGSVYEVLTPNGVRIWVDFTGATVTPSTLTKTATPVATPAGGSSTTPVAVARGTPIVVTSATPGAKIFYTADGTTPDPTRDSPVPTAGIVVNNPVTLTFVAVATGYDPSTALTAVYSIA